MKLFILVIALFSISFASAACQWAGSAVASSENAGSLAAYALNAPDADGECSVWSGYGKSWTPENWNIKANITLNYPKEMNVSNFTIFGDYDLCWDRMWLKNSRSGAIRFIPTTFDSGCPDTKIIGEIFTADSIILETCGWNWGAVDAVQICESDSNTSTACGNGKIELAEECDDGNLISGDGCSSLCKLENTQENTAGCLWAGSAVASSENAGSLAAYALNAPDADGECSVWSGYGKSWTPENWNIKANITLNYPKEMNVSNFTIFGDYDICWDRMWLKNSRSGAILSVPSSFDSSCRNTKPVTENFSADTVILETCGWNWGAVDAVQICGGGSGGGINSTNVSICGNGKIELAEECDDGNLISGDGCSSVCRTESSINNTNTTNTSFSEPVYIIVYLGDIDGSVNPVWYPTYGKLVDFYKENNIPASISFYPGTMVNDSEYKNAINKIYNSENMELIQKGYDGGSAEFNNDKLAPDQQREIAQRGQDTYRAYMLNQFGIDAKPLTTYDLIGGRFPKGEIDSTAAAGFNFYFDIYYASDIGPVNSTEYYDVLQYANSMTQSGAAGNENGFRTVDQVINGFKNYSRLDLNVVKINGTNVIPLSVHQQDFESLTEPGVINQTKWDLYTEVVLRLKQDPNVRFITPREVHKILHSSEDSQICANRISESGEECDDGNLISGDGCSSLCKLENTQENTAGCLWAGSAVASSENAGSLAAYALNAPDADGECSVWSGYGKSWTPENWNIKANITLKYNRELRVKNFTIFGDYDICWDRMWLKNSRSGAILSVPSSFDSSCRNTKPVTENFSADTVILETCGWNWGAVDAVQICGNNDETPPQNFTESPEICKWKNCHRGAVSVSVDDYFTSCMGNLEANGYRGTYFLSDTNTYEDSLWQKYDLAFRNGHELGTHTQSHFCIDMGAQTFVQDINNNIDDIVTHTSAQKNDIVTHAHPCGFVTQDIEATLESNPDWNFLSARGYNINLLEDSTPVDFFNIKSYNSHYYGESEPPSYFNGVDDAESQGKWLNLVFHVECDDDGVINYLPSKDVWVDTIGNVVKYIKMRDSAQISGFTQNSTEINFDLTFNLDESKYSPQQITVRVPVSKNPSSVQINNQSAGFSYFGDYILISVNPTNSHFRIV